MGDKFDVDANLRLQSHLLRGITRRRNYAPDATYERSKLGQAGPHSVEIAEIFSRWAALWADDNRALERDGFDVDLNGTWQLAMRNADLEVDRYLDANKLPREA